MTADIELLPLPEWLLEAFSDPTIERLCDYARANVAHATAARDAEIEALRAEVERLTGCLATANANHEQFERQWYLERDRAERLAEALRAERRWWVERKEDAIREQVGGLTRGDPGAIARCDAAIQRIDAAIEQEARNG